MERVTVLDVDSSAYRALEYLLLLPFAVIALFGVGTLTTGVLGSDGVTALLAAAAIGYIGFILVALVLSVVVPVLLYLDANAVAELNLEWKPEPALYAVLGFFFTGFVVLHYLYKRHQYVVDKVDTDNWWLVAGCGFGLMVLGVVLGVAVNPALFGLTVLGYGMFPVGVYKDAIYVRLNAEWHPNPINHFAAAFFSVVMPPLTLAYFGYYAYKRNKHVGLA